MLKTLMAGVIALAAGTGASLGGEEVKAAAKQYAEGDLAAFLKDFKELKDELKAANEARKGWEAYSEDWKKWNAEEAEKHKNSYTYAEYQWSAKKDKAFRAQFTDTAAAKKLKEFQDKSGGKVVEFFVTDAKGGNVCQSQVTSDWFQGDEEKFSKVESKTENYYADPKRDDTVGKTGVQVSVPMYDGKSFLGVVVVTIFTEAGK